MTTVNVTVSMSMTLFSVILILAVTFTVVIFGQIQSKKSHIYSPLPFSVILQGGFRSSLFGQVNNPRQNI